jgi:hypothetical protein
LLLTSTGAFQARWLAANLIRSDSFDKEKAPDACRHRRMVQYSNRCPDMVIKAHPNTMAASPLGPARGALHQRGIGTGGENRIIVGQENKTGE